MKIFTSAQIRELDKYTIEHEPISSIDLMERAAQKITEQITKRWNTATPMIAFAGPGNNGGDALAVTRMLHALGYDVKAYLLNVKGKLSDDCNGNRERLLQECPDALIEVTREFEPPYLGKDYVVIDGLFGSGINKPVGGGFAAVVNYINKSEAQVVSIDVPSGLMTEDNTYNVRQNIIRADLTLTLGMKKFCMMMADNQDFIGQLEVLDIGLSQEYIANTEAPYEILDDSDIRQKMRRRDDFAHKGSMGHALLVAGSYGMAGAAILAAKACLRSGVGKLTVHTPRRNNDIMQISVPEAVLHLDADAEVFTQPVDAVQYSAMGIGPGLGMDNATVSAVLSQLRALRIPAVIDADALNILASHAHWWSQLPEGIIYTPHPKELDRLCGGDSQSCHDRLMKACDLAQRLRGYVILKGHYSALCMPDGQVVFNSTGNSGMATAGSGDVLTGIITGLLTRGYHPKDAAMVGMYLHGLAGDYALRDLGAECLVASDIIRYLHKAFSKVL